MFWRGLRHYKALGMIKPWNRLPGEAVDSLSLDKLRIGLKIFRPD